LELEVFARIVKRWWLGIIAALLLGGVVGFSYAESRTPVYQAGVDMLVGPLSADSNVLRAAGQTAQTYAELASASATLQAVGRELSNPGASDAMVTATASDVTRILRIRVRDDDAIFVANVANEIAAELERVAGAEVAAAELAGGSEDPNIYRVGEIRVLEAAITPADPISPNKQLIMALGGLSMMVAVAVAVVAYEYTRQAVRVLADVSRIVPGMVFGRIERSWDSIADQKDRIAVLRNENGPTAVSLRGLSIDLASQLPPDSPNCALVFGGVDDSDRSGDVGVNVAVALASTGRRVALIDANEATREVRTWLWKACDHPVEPLAVHINSTARVDLEGRYSKIESGVLDLYSTEMTRLPELVDLETALVDLGVGYDHIVVHTAPVFGSPAASRWAAAAAGSVLVVTSEVASARTVERCALTLSRGARFFIGAVFDERPRLQRRTSLVRRLFGGGRRVEPAKRKVPASAPDPTPVAGPAARPAAQSSGQS
jgi:capsular polysaccharide biosynthesis protein/Mrp family chromosome partitioning ATPase